MKRYILFAYSEWTECGGWYDFVDSFDTVEEAMAAGQERVKKGPDKLYHVLDTDMWEVVFDSEWI